MLREGCVAFSAFWGGDGGVSAGGGDAWECVPWVWGVGGAAWTGAGEEVAFGELGLAFMGWVCIVDVGYCDFFVFGDFV